MPLRHQLRSGSTEDDRVEAVVEQIPWLHRLFQLFQGRPAFAGAFGTAVCALVVGTLVFVTLMGSNSGGSTQAPVNLTTGADQPTMGTSESELGLALTPLGSNSLNGLAAIPASAGSRINPPSTNVGMSGPLMVKPGPPNLFQGINVETLPASYSGSNVNRGY